MTRAKIHTILNGFTKESFEEASATMKTGGVVLSLLPEGMGKDHVFAINIMQYIKATPWFLKYYGDKVCVKAKTSEQNSSSIVFDPVRTRADQVFYNEDGQIIEDIATRETQTFPDVWLDIHQRVIDEFLQMFNLELLQIAKANIQDDIISEEEWVAAEILITKYEKLIKVEDDLRTQDADFLHQEELPQMLIEAASKIDKLVADDDIVIFIGNTPQMIRYPFDQMTMEEKPNLTTVSLGISGHPGVMMHRHPFFNSIKNILNDEQHELYKVYMQDMGLTAESVHGKKIHFVDCINYGGGVAYLMKCVAEMAYGGDISEAQQYFHAINISEYGYATVGERFTYDDITTSVSCLDDSKKLTAVLDAVANDYEEIRLMPDCKSYKWSPEFMVRLTEISQDMFCHAGEVFRPIFAGVDEILASSVVDVEDSELEGAHDAGVECAPDSALTTENPEIGLPVDLAGLNGPAAEVEEA